MHRETVVLCSKPGCGAHATHKIASPWSDGRFSELKTYGFACPDHVGDVLRSAETRWLNYEPVPGEAVHDIGIYRASTGKQAPRWERDPDMEETYLL
ncbi:hypothetical protein [Singulisphaera sp. PoT]|uniref:hypothetical protein n=1 Tax=Singulisphaera sp. PoT TaxID=3411797 RepID=UPI003BF5026E